MADPPEEIPPAKPRLGLSEALEGLPLQPDLDEPAGRGARRLAGIVVGARAGPLAARRRRRPGQRRLPVRRLGPAGPQPKSRPFRVAGIFFCGMYEYDAKFAYIDLDEAQRFFGTGDRMTGLELKMADVERARPIIARVARRAERLALPDQGLGRDEPQPLLRAAGWRSW